MAAGYAATADRIAARYGSPVALICMEQVDERLARAVHRLMKRQEMARVFSARLHNASRMTVLLTGLRLLVTSRYHASVLSLAAHVPQIAVGHDLRLRTLYEDLGIRESLFVDPRAPWMFGRLNDRIDRLMNAPAETRSVLEAGHAAHLGRARQNPALLEKVYA